MGRPSVAKTNAERQADFRKRKKNEHRINLILDFQLGYRLECMALLYGVTKIAMLSKIINSAWSNLSENELEALRQLESEKLCSNYDGSRQFDGNSEKRP
jgi:hypothetical protein